VIASGWPAGGGRGLVRVGSVSTGVVLTITALRFGARNGVEVVHERCWGLDLHKKKRRGLRRGWTERSSRAPPCVSAEMERRDLVINSLEQPEPSGRQLSRELTACVSDPVGQDWRAHGTVSTCPIQRGRFSRRPYSPVKPKSASMVISTYQTASFHA